MCHEGKGRESSITDFSTGWVGFGVDLNALEKSLLHWVSNPGFPIP